MLNALRVKFDQTPKRIDNDRELSFSCKTSTATASENYFSDKRENMNYQELESITAASITGKQIWR